MKETKPKFSHTPGPWHVTGMTGIHIRGDENIPAERYHIGGNGHVCTVDRPGPIAQADARLIKQAPALLRVCQDLLEEVRQNIKDFGGCDHSAGICCCGSIRLCDHAARVISRATGEQTENP